VCHCVLAGSRGEVESWSGLEWMSYDIIIIMMRLHGYEMFDSEKERVPSDS